MMMKLREVEHKLFVWNSKAALACKANEDREEEWESEKLTSNYSSANALNEKVEEVRKEGMKE